MQVFPECKIYHWNKNVFLDNLNIVIPSCKDETVEFNVAIPLWNDKTGEFMIELPNLKSAIG
jgi:hypothetical protein